MEFLNNSFETGRVTHRTVQPEEIDELGHVNNAVYVAWIQEAATEHWYAVTKPDLQDKYIWICSRHEIDYKGELLEGEQVEIRTWLGEFKGARFDRFVEIRREGSDKPGVQAKTTWVLMDKHARRPLRIKDEVLAPLRA